MNCEDCMNTGYNQGDPKYGECDACAARSGKYGRFNISTLATGRVPLGDDPYRCEGCDRRIMHGQPYWGGGFDYYGEALEVRCARCQAGDERATERQVRDYERGLCK